MPATDMMLLLTFGSFSASVGTQEDLTQEQRTALAENGEHHPPAWTILVALAAMGIYGMTGQIILVRELLVIFYGSELSLGLVFSCWLLWVSIGAALASRTVPRFRRPGRFLLLGLLLALAALPAEISLVRSLRGILGTPPGLLIPLGHIALATALVLMPLSFLIGYTFPLGATLYARRASGAARRIGLLYIAETAGSILGAALFTLLFAGRLGHFQTAAILGLPLAASGVLLARELAKAPSRSMPIGGGAVLLSLTLFLLGGGASWLEELTAAYRWKLGHPGIEWVEARDSRYQHLAVGALSGQITLYGNGTPIVSLPDTYDAGISAHLLLAQQPAPTRMLMIGGGTPAMISEILKHPVMELDYVEMDPEMISLLREYGTSEASSSMADSRLHIHAQDGRAYLKKTEQHYDLIVVLLPDPSTANLNRFYTVEFFQEVTGRLTPQGVFAFDVGGAVNYVGAEVGAYRATLYQSLKSVFPYVLVTPGEQSFFFASTSTGTITDDPKVLASRYAARAIDSPSFSPVLYAELLAPERMSWMRRELEQIDVDRLNSDWQPISYFQNVLLWDKFSESGMGALLKRISGLQLWMLAAGVMGLLILRLLWIRTRPLAAGSSPIFNSLSTIATTGFMAMGTQLIILFVFQNQLGYVYEKVGLVVAAFMLGLFAGGRWASGVVSRAIRTRRILRAFDVMIVLLCLALPFLLAAPAAFGKWALGLPTEIWFYILSGTGGFLAAFQFPLASRLYLEHRESVAGAAGRVDWADHIGAAAGALVVGSLLIPLLGVIQTCFVLAAIKAGNLVLLSVGLRKTSP